MFWQREFGPRNFAVHLWRARWEFITPSRSSNNRNKHTDEAPHAFFVNIKRSPSHIYFFNWCHSAIHYSRKIPLVMTGTLDQAIWKVQDRPIPRQDEEIRMEAIAEAIQKSAETQAAGLYIGVRKTRYSDNIHLDLQKQSLKKQQGVSVFSLIRYPLRRTAPQWSRIMCKMLRRLTFGACFKIADSSRHKSYTAIATVVAI